MKIMKNKFFKIASLMIMLCLISTCAIGTTFAKYVTGDTATDSARVAKWGVKIEMQGDDLFSNQYDAHDTELAGKLSVKSSSDDEKVVAPGTSGSTVFSIKGTPEVAARIVIDFDATSDIMLPAGSVQGQTEDYHPLVFTLKQIADADGAVDVVLKVGTLADIQAFLDAYTGTNGTEYLPNTDLASKFELSWAWAYSVDDLTDKMDTLLGDLMAAKIEAEAKGEQYTLPTGVSLNVVYNLSITVTQVD